VQLPNVPEFVFAYFGILRAGLVMVPLNPLLTAPEIAYHLTDSDARLPVTSALFLEAAQRGAIEAGDLPVYVAGEGGSGGRLHRFDELLADDGRDDLYPTASDDTAVLLYTSGTTGRPKGAELNHFQLYMNCTVAGGVFGMAKSDVSTAVLPLFHV
jgi:long-chain acyl-CoA synthetase